MQKSLLFSLLFFLSFLIQAQSFDPSANSYLNSADKLLSSDGKLLIGGYGEVHYNQPLSSETRNNGKLDVHRVVMLLGYNFSSKTQFVTEIEYEHVSEVYVEQAFLQHKINNFLNLRAGLLLIPMGIINEYHEPTTFNGVERPSVDSKISPTTWREIGFGASGNIIEASMKYQVYLVNGFNGYNGSGTLNGKNGLRSGRQKGADSYISAPNLSFKVEYYGVKSLNLGLAGYFGKTQSTLYNGIDRNNEAAFAKADSSVTGISMLGLDARYNLGGLQLRGQYYFTAISNTMQYNAFTAKDGKANDLGSAMQGYYIEAGYNVFKHFTETQSELIPFVRLENYNTHQATDENLQKNLSYNNNIVTTGLTYKLVKGVVAKIDIQLQKPENNDSYNKTFNAGIGVMF